MDNTFQQPVDRIGAWRTDYLTVNGVNVRLVVQRDRDGNEYVLVDADGGNLEGEMPGMYYPVPAHAATV